MKLIAVKPLVYDGVRYEAGEIFSPSLIPDKKVRTLINGRLIKYVEDAEVIAANDVISTNVFEFPYKKDGKAAAAKLTLEQLLAVLRVLQTNLQGADEALECIEDEEVASFLLSVEKRAGVVSKITKKFASK